ncbi:PAS domain S-box-containing protein [Halorubrum vacuolatum]|uniref:PAS domain S-box-containing protein n=2 Tax=Halorubrum vacuolatum TaxID=63740 RepID=A0A238XFD5_HALVU|nr:PAS domain S-box-containing protein [Halorubrum vacuolatum]
MLRAPTAIIAAEAETGTVVAVNEAATELFGRSRSSLIGVHQTELHPTDTEQQHREGFESVKQGDETLTYADEDPSVSILRRDGTTIPVDVRSTTVTHNGTTYVLGVFQDARDRLARIEQLERQSTAIDISPAGIGLLDADETYSYLNDAHASLFGYDRTDELIGGSWTQFYDDEVVERIRTDILPVVMEVGSWEGELVGRRKDGSAVTHRVELARLPDGGLACVNVDLSDRERMRERLAETRKLVGALMAASDREAAIEVAIEAITDLLNRSLIGYWSFTEDENRLVPLKVSSDSDVIVDEPPRFAPGESLAWEAFDAGEMRYYPNLGDRSDAHNPDTRLGSEIIVPVERDGVLIVGSPMRDDLRTEEREIIGIIARYLEVAIALVDRKRRLEDARERAESERNQLKQIIDTVPQLIFAKNAKGEFILANEAVADAYGTTVSDLIGSTDADYSADPEEVDAFTEDDRHVLETGTRLHRSEETLTDADGNERILETWKIPFDPVDTEERAVLGVANDITDLTGANEELRRQRKLKNLYAVSNSVFQAETVTDAYNACVNAVAGAVTTDEVAIYVQDPEDGALVRRAVAGDADAYHLPERVAAGETAVWQALGASELQWLDAASVIDSRSNGETRGGRETEPADDSGPSGGTAVPTSSVFVTSLDKTSVLIAVVEERNETIEAFFQAVTNQIAAALTQLQQASSLQELSGDVENTQQIADRYQTLWEGVINAIEAVVSARTQSEVFNAVQAFGEHLGDYAHLSTYDPVNELLDVVTASEVGGPAKLYERDEEFPAVIAGKRNTVEHVSDTQPADEAYDEWRSQLLYFGYRESLAAPVSHSGTVYAVVELVSTTVDRFGGPERRAIRAVADVAGKCISALEMPPTDGSPVVFSIECHDPAPLFPELPKGGTISINYVAMTGSDAVHVAGTADGYEDTELREYLIETPGIVIDSVERLSEEQHGIELSITDHESNALGTLQEITTVTNTRITGLRAQPSGGVIRFLTTNSDMIGIVRERLTEEHGSCTLVAKYHPSESSGGQGSPENDAGLTARQQAIMETAFREGYYEDPRKIDGAQLADRFDISSSTLHQHLRAAEAKVIDQFLNR